MCGRITFTDPEAIAAAFRTLGADPGPTPHPRRYNGAPSQVFPVAMSGPRVTLLRWGFVPFYARKEEKPFALINARSETVAEKPSFRQSVQARRCLVPADGFFEWQRHADNRKTPFHIRLRTAAPFWIAGIYEEEAAPHPAGFALLTTGPNELMRPIHDRMPVILPLSDAREWLQPGPIAPDRLAQLCRHYPAEEMAAYPVSTIVNSARNDVPECVQPVLRAD